MPAVRHDQPRSRGDRRKIDRLDLDHNAMLAKRVDQDRRRSLRMHPDRQPGCREPAPQGRIGRDPLGRIDEHLLTRSDTRGEVAGNWARQHLGPMRGIGVEFAKAVGDHPVGGEDLG